MEKNIEGTQQRSVWRNLDDWIKRAAQLLSIQPIQQQLLGRKSAELLRHLVSSITKILLNGLRANPLDFDIFSLGFCFV
jgi:hypothetical protein